MKIALIQNKPAFNKKQNLENIKSMIPNEEFNILVLPECFNSPYGTEYFAEYAENLSNLEGETVKFLHNLSLEYNTVLIIAGSIPEKFNRNNDTVYYNTCTIWKNGEIINRYRKMHLFDVFDSNSNYVFQESLVLTRGDEPCVINTPWGNIGIGICFDLRFNELSNFYQQNNCKLIVYPGNFTQWSGEKHWELLLRSRAIDTQAFIIGCSTTLNDEMNYKSYGNSLIVNPWGEIIMKYNNKETVNVLKIDIYISNHVKQRIPLNNVMT